VQLTNLLGNRLRHQWTEFCEAWRSLFTGDGFYLPTDVAGYRFAFDIEYTLEGSIRFDFAGESAADNPQK
jgi:hypothetical protein